MAMLFPTSAEFTGGLYKPARFEGDVFDLEVDGEVPEQIDRTFIQVAPDPQYPPMLGEDIFFNGDGAISAFSFKKGHVDFKRRYVMTERLKAQRAARASLHGIYRNPYTNDPSVRDLNNSTANTNVVVHGGKLLALKEDSAPYALDPITMETIGDGHPARSRGTLRRPAVHAPAARRSHRLALANRAKPPDRLAPNLRPHRRHARSVHRGLRGVPKARDQGVVAGIVEASARCGGGAQM